MRTVPAGTKKILRILSEEEKKTRAMENVTTENDIRSVMSEAKAVANDYKSKLSFLEDRKTKNRAAINEGVWEDVEIENHMNDKTLTVTVIRKDTGEIVETRPYTTGEKQLDLGKV